MIAMHLLPCPVTTGYQRMSLRQVIAQWAFGLVVGLAVDSIRCVHPNKAQSMAEISLRSIGERVL